MDGDRSGRFPADVVYRQTLKQPHPEVYLPRVSSTVLWWYEFAKGQLFDVTAQLEETLADALGQAVLEQRDRIFANKGFSPGDFCC